MGKLMQTKLIILILVLLGVSACEMEKKFQEFDLEEITVLNHQVYSQLFETSKEKYFFRAYHYKRTPDSVETLYPEEVYLATMKIMDSYGVDTNKYDRKFKVIYNNEILYNRMIDDILLYYK